MRIRRIFFPPILVLGRAFLLSALNPFHSTSSPSIYYSLSIFHPPHPPGHLFAQHTPPLPFPNPLAKILAAMKPLVSAAAAALLLVGGRRGARPPDDQSLLSSPDSEPSPPPDDCDEPPGDDNKDSITSDPFSAWDWTDPPDDTSIWAATAAVLGGLSRTQSESSDSDFDSQMKDTKDAFENSFETLAAALRGLRVFPARASGEPDEDKYDVRPLIAVTIGVTLFLLTRSPKAARRAELEAGVSPGMLVDEHDFVDTSGLQSSHISDLRAVARDIVIVTTAAMPWMTGTAVNPLLRAVYLAKAGHTVSLVVPWLESPEDQRKVYPKGTSFKSKEEQAALIMDWAQDQVADVEIVIRFYEGVYSKEFGSILPLGDITAMFGDDEPRDVCILEEPEHLTWHHTGSRWTSLFKFCVGVVHTNYIEYAKKHGIFGPQRALFLNFLNKWVCRSYCHRVIKLSDAVQTLPHSVTCNVHGVRDRFIDIGSSRQSQPFINGAYFLGKVLWAKGYRQLVDLMDEHYNRTEERLPIDFFGAGPDLDAVKSRVRDSYGLSLVQVHGVVVDHASEYLQRYKVYVNPSKSDVVCTATAEALAMGKFVVCLKHPSNEFFATFDNCLIYETAEQFSSQLAYALAHEPKPLSDDDMFRLSWEAATERFYDASFIPCPPRNGRVDSALALAHKTFCATLVTPPANNAVRARYRHENKRPRELVEQGATRRGGAASMLEGGARKGRGRWTGRTKARDNR